MDFIGMDYSRENAENWVNSKMKHFDDKLSKKTIFQQSFWPVAKTLGNFTST